MERNNGIAIVIVCMFLLLVSITTMLVILFGNYEFNDSNSLKIESKDQTFNDRIDEVMQEFDEREIGECFDDLQLSIAERDLDTLESKFEVCKIKANEHNNALKRLKTYATSSADRREIEIIQVDISITENGLMLMEYGIEILRLAENNEIDKTELNQILFQIKTTLVSLQSDLDMLDKYSDTYFYEKYIDNPEYNDVSYYKGQIDAFESILSNY